MATIKEVKGLFEGQAVDCKYDEQNKTVTCTLPSYPKKGKNNLLAVELKLE